MGRLKSVVGLLLALLLFTDCTGIEDEVVDYNDTLVDLYSAPTALVDSVFEGFDGIDDGSMEKKIHTLQKSVEKNIALLKEVKAPEDNLEFKNAVALSLNNLDSMANHMLPQMIGMNSTTMTDEGIEKYNMMATSAEAMLLSNYELISRAQKELCDKYEIEIQSEDSTSSM